MVEFHLLFISVSRSLSYMHALHEFTNNEFDDILKVDLLLYVIYIYKYTVVSKLTNRFRLWSPRGLTFP